MLKYFLLNFSERGLNIMRILICPQALSIRTLGEHVNPSHSTGVSLRPEARKRQVPGYSIFGESIPIHFELFSKTGPRVAQANLKLTI